MTDPAAVERVLDEAAAAHGGVDLVVDAASAYGGERRGPFGGGPIIEAQLDAFDSWAGAPARSAFSFLSAAGRFLERQGRQGTLVQVTGGSSRRAAPGRGLWAAGAFGVRAITQAAALELREIGIHVALLIVDAGIEPRGGAPGSRARPWPTRARSPRPSPSWPTRERARPPTSCRSHPWPSAGSPRPSRSSGAARSLFQILF